MGSPCVGNDIKQLHRQEVNNLVKQQQAFPAIVTAD